MFNKKLIDTRYCTVHIFTSFYSGIAWLIERSIIFHVLIFKGFYNSFTQVLGVDSVKNRLQEQATQKRQKPLTTVSTWISRGHTHAGNTTREKHAYHAWALLKRKENKSEATPFTMLLDKYDTTKKQKKLKERLCTIVATWLSFASHEHGSGASCVPHVSLVKNCM